MNRLLLIDKILLKKWCLQGVNFLPFYTMYLYLIATVIFVVVFCFFNSRHKNVCLFCLFAAINTHLL